MAAASPCVFVCKLAVSCDVPCSVFVCPALWRLASVYKRPTSPRTRLFSRSTSGTLLVERVLPHGLGKVRTDVRVISTYGYECSYESPRSERSLPTVTSQPRYTGLRGIHHTDLRVPR